MIVGPITFSLTVSPEENEPDFAVATVTAERTDGKRLDNPHVFVQPADLVLGHGGGSVRISLSRDLIRRGLGRIAVRIKDPTGQSLADVALAAFIDKNGGIAAQLKERGL
jgi:hypothetical protein